MASNPTLGDTDYAPLESPDADVPSWVNKLVDRWSAFSGWNLVLSVLLLAVASLELVFGNRSLVAEHSVLALAVIALTFFRRRSPLAALTTVVGLNMVLALWARHRLGVVDTSGVRLASVGLATTVCAYSAFRWSNTRVKAVAFAVVVFGGTFMDFVLERDGPFPSVMARLVPWGFVMSLAVAATYRAHFGEQHKAQIRQAERQELARELHDVVAHHVSAIAITAQAAQAVADVNPDAVLASLDSIEETASLTLTEMRRMVGILRGKSLTSTMVGSLSLPDLAEAPGLPRVNLSGGEFSEGVPIAVRAAITRIVQESITNARRHGDSDDPIEVVVSHSPDEISVRVVNTALGGTMSSGGYGLVGMSERAEALQGTFRYGYLPGDRWQVYASIPIETAEEEV